MVEGTLIEGLKFTSLFHTNAPTTAVTLYNGSGISTSLNGIDTLNYDEIVFMVQSGTMTGSTAAVSVFESATNNPRIGLSKVSLDNMSGTDTDADFTEFSGTGSEKQVAAIKCKNSKRYLWLTVLPSGATVNISASCVLGKANELPIDNSPVFDIGL